MNHIFLMVDGCHDLMEEVMNLNDVAIISIKGNDYRIHSWYTSNNDAVSIMKTFNLNKKSGLP